MKKDLYLHIGYPKTGTTTLQECIAQAIQGVRVFLPNINFEHNKNQYTRDDDVIRMLLKSLHSDNFHPNTSYIEQTLLQNNECDHKIFISSVNIIAAPFYKNALKNFQAYDIAEELATRIHKMFSQYFNIKIIFIIRQQASWIPSAYAEWRHYFARDKNASTFPIFLNSFFENERYNQGLNYNNIAKPFEKHFKKENIYIGVYEELANSPTSFYQKLVDFMGGTINNEITKIPPKRNVRTTTDGHKKIDAFNLEEWLYFLKLKFFPNHNFSLAYKFPFVVKLLRRAKLFAKDDSQTIKLTANQANRIQSLYTESNETLSKRYGLNLKSYGYCQDDI